MKRSNPYKRGLTEQRLDCNKQYHDYIKRPVPKNIFTERPHYGIPEPKEGKGC
jgi:hypothetical protein